jgi:Effector Associated Constant Component 1
MTDQTIRLTLNVYDTQGTDADELSTLTQQLRDELLETDVKEVRFISEDNAPEGSRAVDPVTLGTLAVTFAASGGVFTTLINTIQAWLLRDEKHSITLEGPDGNKITITGRPSREEKQLVETWIRKNLGA